MTMALKEPPLKKALRSTWPRVRKIIHLGKERYLVDARPHAPRELWDNVPDALAAAERIVRQRRNDGAASFAELSPSDRRDASEALSILPPNVTLLDAARAYCLETKRRVAADTCPTVSSALDQYLTSKKSELDRGELSKLTLYELTSNARIIRQAFDSLKINELAEATVARFVESLTQKPQGRKNILTKVSQFLNYCVRQKWLTANPAAGIKIKVRAREVEILSVDEVRRLLAVTCDTGVASSGVFPFLVLQLYGGLRPFEASRMRWESIHFETGQIEVRGETSKTRETRFVPMIAPLPELLLPYRRSHGPLPGPRFELTLREVKRAAGLVPWKVDCLRHSFASYWLPIHQNRVELCEILGNSLAVVKKHYRKAIPRTVAEEFWSISLNPAAVIPFAAKARPQIGR
jgi:integrase